MQGKHQRESGTDTIHLRSVNQQGNGNSDARDLASINAKLVRENAQLTRERDLLRTIIDSLPDPIYVKDDQSRFLMSNLACAQALGAAGPEEIANKTDFDFFPKEFAERYLADEQTVMQSGETLDTVESFLEKATGENRWMQTTKVARRDSQGNVIGLIGIGRDITELKRAKEVSSQELEKRTAQLSQERLLLRTLIDNLPVSVYIKDTTGRKTLANPADLKNLRCKTEAEAVGKTDFDFFPREIAEKFRADEQKVFQGQPLINREEYFLDEQGHKCWLLTCKVPLRDLAGNIIGLVGMGQNITEHKQTEELLDRERVLLRTLIDNLPDCIYAKDAAGRKTLANPADLKNLRCKTEADAIGKNDFDLFPKEIAEKFWADDQKVILGYPVINREEYFTDELGNTEWLLTSKLPLRDPDGKIVGLIGIGRNITRRKEMEVSLAYEKQLLQLLLEALPDNIYFKDRESRFVRVSRSKVEATFQSVRQNHRVAHPNDPPDSWPTHLADVKTFGKWLIGKTDFDTYPESHARATWEDEQEIMRTGQSVVGKLQKTELPNGRIIWWLSTKMPWRDKEGNIIGTFGTSLDVTKLKQMEGSLDRERVLLRTLIDNLPDCIYAKDTDGRFVLNNLAHAQRRGLKSPAEMKGKSDFDYFPRNEAEQFFADEQKILQTGEPVINQEQYMGVGDGSSGKRWAAVSKVVWRDDQGQVLGTVGITRDVHEFKMAREALRTNEIKLREFAAQLERSNRELQDFAYVASHDLQEPLRKIVVFGERLKEKAADRLEPETLDYLQRMQKAASRMQTLINDLLAFSRVTTKAQPFTQVDLAQTAQEVREDLEGRIELTKGRVELGQLPVIDGEPLQIRQLLQNLVGNALKFRRPEVPPVVKIEAKIFSGVLPESLPDTAPQQLCELAVSDNGIGFDEKYLDRIFNVFQRLHTRNEYEGTGMGLAIARKIVLYHGGVITARSTPGQGTAFIATLPVSHPKSNPDER